MKSRVYNTKVYEVESYEDRLMMLTVIKSSVMKSQVNTAKSIWSQEYVKSRVNEDKSSEVMSNQK